MTSILEWMLLNVVLALLPLILNLVLFSFFRLNSGVRFLLKNGEMFFYAVTISSYSIGSLLLRSDSKRLETESIMLLFVLIFILLSSSMIFGFVSLLTLWKEHHPRSKLANVIRTDDRRFAIGSGGFAAWAAIFSYLAYAQG